MMYVVKKDGTKEIFDVQKIVKAVNKSAARILYKFQDQEVEFICGYAKEKPSLWIKMRFPYRRCITLWKALWKR